MSGTNYRLVDDGYPTFKKIKRGSKWIGDVKKTELGYVGIIGSTTVKAPTEDKAFQEVVAKYCGHANYTAMAAKNTAVRAVNRQRKAEARYVTEELIRGNFKPLDRLMGFGPKEDKDVE
jgi:hypothetical protein